MFRNFGSKFNGLGNFLECQTFHSETHFLGDTETRCLIYNTLFHLKLSRVGYVVLSSIISSKGLAFFLEIGFKYAIGISKDTSGTRFFFHRVQHSLV